MSSDDFTALHNRSLICFDQSVSSSARYDLLDLLLYAQLSSDKQYDRLRRWQEWLFDHQQRLRSVGARQVGQLISSRLKIKSAAELKKLPLHVSGLTSSPQLKQIADRALDQLLKSEHAQTYFSTWFSSGLSQSFEITPCVSDGQGGVTIMVCSLQMRTSAVDTQLPWYWQLSPAGFLYGLAGALSVTSAGGAFSYSPQEYEPHRQRVRDFLAQQAASEVIRL